MDTHTQTLSLIISIVLATAIVCGTVLNSQCTLSGQVKDVRQELGKVEEEVSGFKAALGKVTTRVTGMQAELKRLDRNVVTAPELNATELAEIVKRAIKEAASESRSGKLEVKSSAVQKKK